VVRSNRVITNNRVISVRSKTNRNKTVDRKRQEIISNLANRAQINHRVNHVCSKTSHNKTVDHSHRVSRVTTNNLANLVRSKTIVLHKTEDRVNR
jgi:hypothetical protein